MSFPRSVWSRLFAAALLLTSGCESVYQVPNRFAVLFGPEWRKYVNADRQVAIAFMGQSNALGIGDSTLSPILPDSTAYEFVFTRVGTGGTGTLKPLRDPICAHRPPLYRSQTGSLIPACALRYKELTGLKPVIIQVANGGTWLATIPSRGNGGWEPNGYLRTDFIYQTQKLLEYNGFERLAWINMTLGESDGVNCGRFPNELQPFPDGMIVPGTYDAEHGYPNGYPNPTHIQDLYSGYRQMIEEFRTNFPGVKININQTGTNIREDEPAIMDGIRQMWLVQEHLARTIPGVFCEMKDAKYFEAFGFMQADRVHYTQQGYNYVGRLDGQIMANH